MIIYLDGDNIGDMIETLLMDDKPTEAADFSKRVKGAISSAAVDLEKLGFDIIFVGGDDIVAQHSGASPCREKIDKIRINFQRTTGATLSAGIATTFQGSITNLRRAKITGKNKLVEKNE